MTSVGTAAVGAVSGVARPDDSLKISVISAGARVDLVVPKDVEVGALAAACGLPPTVRLATAGGRLLDSDLPLAAQRVGDGALLVVVDPAADPVGRRGAAARVAVAVVGRGRVAEVGAVLGALALAGLAAGGMGSAEPAERAAVAAGLALVALLAAVLPASLRAGQTLPASLRAGQTQSRVSAFALLQTAAPGFAAAAAVAVVSRNEAGEDLLAMVAAGVVAAQVAVLLRPIAEPVARAALLVWAICGGLVAASAAAVLFGEGSPRVVWAVLLVLAVAAAKLMPRLVVDVPDEQLLDVDELAATSWSARLAVRGPKRLRVRADEVGAAVELGRRLLDAGAVAVAAAAVAGAVGLALDPGPGWTQWPAYAAGMVVGVVLAVASRGFVGGLPRVVLRVGGLVAALAGAGGALAACSPVALAGVAGGAGFVGLLAAAAAPGLGRGRRSVWWSRLGDGLEGLCVVATFPVALLAVDAFEHFRRMQS